MKANIDIVIVSWNSEKFITSCIESIFNTGLFGQQISQVIIVDNGSTDETVKSIRIGGWPVILKENNENLGFAAACNQGAKRCSSELILFLNPDTTINKESVEAAIACSQERLSSNIGIFGLPMSDDHGESSCGARFPSARSFFASALPPAICKVLRLRRSTLMRASELQPSRDIDQVIGAFFLVRTRLYMELDGFDERYYVYFEEVDFSLRAAKIGWRSHVVNGPPIYHFGGGSSSSVKALRLFYSLNSRLRYSAKNFTRLEYLIVFLVTFLLEPVSRIGSEIFKGDVKAAGGIIYAYSLLIGSLIGIVSRGD